MRRIVALNLEIVGICTILIAICGVQGCARVIPTILEGRVEPPLPKPIFKVCEVLIVVREAHKAQRDTNLPWVEEFLHYLWKPITGG